jgi:glyoxylase-like metal-dependent hydrolase (beta-lactamase superfamily II)
MRTRHSVAVLALALLMSPWSALHPVAQQGAAVPPAAPGGGGGRGGGRGAGGPQPAVGSLPAHRFEQVGDGVYYSTSTGSMTTGANSCIIVNDQDVFVLDPGESPAAGRALIQDIKSITSKPIKFVGDSHYHFDHSHGNGAFGPDVTIIAPDRNYDRLSGAEGNVLRGQTYVTQAAPALLQTRLDTLKAQPAPTDPQAIAARDRQIAAAELRITQEKEIVPTPATTTFSTRMTLHRGSREIQLLYLGRGHTDTDMFVYLPKERIVCTGDMMETGLAYLPDAWVNEWPDALEKLAALDFDLVLPGHGAPFHGKEHIRAFQSYLRDLYKQVMALRAQGLSPADAVAKVDLTSHTADFPGMRPVDIRGVQRIYDVAANPNSPERHMDTPAYPVIW